MSERAWIRDYSLIILKATGTRLNMTLTLRCKVLCTVTLQSHDPLLQCWCNLCQQKKLCCCPEMQSYKGAFSSADKYWRTRPAVASRGSVVLDVNSRSLVWLLWCVLVLPQSLSGHGGLMVYLQTLKAKVIQDNAQDNTLDEYFIAKQNENLILNYFCFLITNTPACLLVVHSLCTRPPGT